MMDTKSQRAFTLIEVLVTLAIIMILAGGLAGWGKYLKTAAQRQLTQSAIEVICTAMQQYYDQTKKFPPMVSCLDCPDLNPDNTPQSLKATLSANLVKVSQGLPDDIYFWQSATAYYFLNRVSQSRTILESLVERVLSNKDKNGAGVQVQIQLVSTGPTETYDWIRFVDAWGTSLKYEYQSGYSFPVITSAGPDGKFKTEDDLSSR